MQKTSAFKNFKKAMCLVLVLAFVLTLLPANLTLANSSDVVTAFDKLNALPTSSKNAILNALWNYGFAQIGDGQPIVAEDVVDKAAQVLKENGIDVVVDDAVAGDGKISRSTLVEIVKEIIPYKALLLSYYKKVEPLVDKAEIKEILGLPSNASKMDVFTALLPLAAPVITKTADGKGLKPVDNFSDVVTAKFVSFELAKKIAQAFERSEAEANLLIVALMVKLDNHIDELTTIANEIIASPGMNIDDAVHILNAYGLYKDSSTPTTSPTTTPTPTPAPNNGGGGVIFIPTPAPVTEATDGKSALNTLDQGLKDLEKLNAEESAKKAKELIGAVNKVAVNASTTADELNKLVEKIYAIADVVMQKAGTEVVAPTVTGSTAKVVVKDESVAALTKKIEAVLAVAKDLNDTLGKAGIGAKVKATLTLDAKTSSNVNETIVELTAKLLSTGADKKLDRIAIVTNVATTVIAPNAVPQNEGAVVFGAKKLDGDSYDFTATAGGKAIGKFSKPVEITVPYTVKATEDPKKITVFYNGENGSQENVAGVYDEAKKSVVFTTGHFSKYTVKVNTVTFGDIAEQAWAKEYVETMAAKGFIKGIGEGKFAPSRNITRAEFAALIIRGFKLSDDSAVNNFSDVKKEDWFSADVAAAAKLGIIKGNGNGTFSPDANITRQDMAVMVARALEIVKEKPMVDAAKYQLSFTDSLKVADYAKAAVATNVRYGIVKGMTNGSFAPADSATRAEAATFIYRLFFLK